MFKYLFYAVVFALSLGQFSVIYQSGGLKIYLFDVLICGFVSYGILICLLKKHFKFLVYHLLFLAFCIFAALSLLRVSSALQFSDLVSASFYQFRLVFYFFSGVIVFNATRMGLISFPQVYKSFILSGVFVSLTGCIQLLVLPDLEVLDPLLGWDPHKNRLVSTFLDPNFVGGYLVLCMTVFLYMPKRTLASKVAFLFMLLALFFTYSRSSWAMFAVIMLIYGIFKSRIALIVAVLLMLSAYFAVPRIQTRIAGITDPADSAHFRLISWRNTWEIAKDNLYMGVGFNNFRNAQLAYGFVDPGDSEAHGVSGSDSSILLVLATTGVFGLSLFLIAYIYPMLSFDLFKLSVGASLLLHSQFVNSFFYPQILFFFFVMVISSPNLQQPAKI